MALASKNGFLFVFDRVTGKPLWPIEERPVPQSDVPGEVTSPTQPFPTVLPPFGRQGMTVKDMYDLFMTDEEKALVEGPLARARHGPVYAAGFGRHDPHAQRQRRRVVLRHRRRPDQRNGVRAIGKDMPSIVKLVPAGESTAVEFGRADSRPAPPDGRGGGAGPVAIRRSGSAARCTSRTARPAMVRI